MTITIDGGMVDEIKGGSDKLDSDTITYSINVDPGSPIQELAESLGITFDPIVVTTPGPDAAMIQEMVPLWDDVIAKSIEYRPGDEGADITVNTIRNMPAGFAGLTYTTLHSAWPDDSDVYLPQRTIGLGDFAWGSALHEFGHALGLVHPGNYNANQTPTYEGNRKYDTDTVQFSVMSYFDPGKIVYSPPINWTRSANHPQTPMIYDILAIQAHYGADTTTRLGDTTYGFNSTAGHRVYDFTVNPNPVLTLWDAGGAHDELDLSGFSGNQRVDLHEGSYSDIGNIPFVQNVAIAFGTWIEDATGGSGNDDITGNQFDNFLHGGGGGDTLRGELGNDDLYGEAGDDFLYGDDGADRFDGGIGVDHLFGGAGDDLMLGGDLGDEIVGDQGADTLAGGDGPDTLVGGDGTDTATFGGSIGVTVSLATNVGTTGEAAGDLITGVENLVGTDVGDDLTGDAGPNRLDGAKGDDTLKGGGGADQLVGGEGFDTVTYTASLGAVTVDLAGIGHGNDAEGDSYDGIEKVIGSNEGDLLVGDGLANQLFGGLGPDVLRAAGGNDLVDGEAGDDTLVGDPGNDTMKGGLGVDTVDFSGTAQPVEIHLSTHVGPAPLSLALPPSADGFETGHDLLSGIENAYGGAGDDDIFGDAGANRLKGGGGADALNGLGGADTLIGGPGNDTIDGGDGFDTVDLSGATGPVEVFLAFHEGVGGTGLPPWSDSPDDGLDALTDVEAVIGGAGGDHIDGASDGNRLDGGGGADRLRGFDGADTLVGGLGDDTLDGGDGADTVDLSAATQGVEIYLAFHIGSGGTGLPPWSDSPEYGLDSLTGMEDAAGGAGADRIQGASGANRLSGNGGNDDVLGFQGDDTLLGGLGDDTLDGGEGFDFADYSDAPAGVAVDLGPAGTQNTQASGFDTLTGIEGIVGSPFDDVLLRGFGASVVLKGGAGDDTFHDHDAGADSFDGGDGFDTLDYATGGADAVTVDLLAGTAVSAGGSVNTLVAIEGIGGSEGADQVTGDDGANRFLGRGGADLFTGAGGDDSFEGGDGADTAMFGGAVAGYALSLASGRLVVTDTVAGRDGADTLSEVETLQFADRTLSTAVPMLIEGASDDSIPGDAVARIIDGGDGLDTIDYSGLATPLYVDLAIALAVKGAAADTLLGIENVVGTAQADALVGNGGANSVSGLAGIDFLFGGSFAGDGSFLTGTGNDTLIGGDGDDGLWGADGDDSLSGGLGNDALVGGAGNDSLEGGDGSDILLSADFSATGPLPGSGADRLLGGAGNDGLWGYDAADALWGDAGDDYVEAGTGNDFVFGGAGNDTLLGQEGADILTGDEGFDYLYGGAGADTFEFDKGDSYDTVWDFSAAEGDKLRLDPAFGLTTFAQLQPLLTGFSFEGADYTVITLNGGLDQITLKGIAHTAVTAAMVELIA